MDNSFKFIEKFLNSELREAKISCRSNRVVELESVIHHLKIAAGNMDKIGGFPVVTEEDTCWEISNRMEFPDLYIIKVSEAYFHKKDLSDEVCTGYEVEDGCYSEETFNHYLLVRYIGE